MSGRMSQSGIYGVALHAARSVHFDFCVARPELLTRKNARP